MRSRVALVVLVLAAGSLAAAAFAGAGRARTVARERIDERLLVAARGGAALCEAYLDALAETLRTAALGFESSKAPIDERLRALLDRSEHFRIVSFTDEEGRPLRDPVYHHAATPGTGLRRHPPVAPAEVEEHLRQVPREEALRTGFGLSAPFMRGNRGPFVVLASSFQVSGESHPTGDPCHPGSRHVIAAEIGLEWLIGRLRVGAGGPHEVLLLDDRFRVLGGEHALGTVAGLGPARSPQAVTMVLPGDARATPPAAPALAALAPVPRYGWSVLVRADRRQAAPLMSSFAIGWAAASLVVLLAAAVALARGAR